MMSSRRQALVVVLACAWLGVVGAAFAALANYSNAPGPSAKQAPRRWPEATALERSGDRATLLVFAHPGCPCTRASLSELAALLREVGQAVQPVVVFRKGSPETLSTLRDQAAAIPGVVIQVDEQGTEAKRFDAKTSGQALLYDQKGELLFEGGLTMARGHEGASPGRLQIAALLAGIETSHSAKVYGCALGDLELRDARLSTNGASP